MPAAYAADVPLICDPVPGGFVVITSATASVISQFDGELRSFIESFARVWPATDIIEFCAEWPDAEFCAA